MSASVSGRSAKRCADKTAGRTNVGEADWAVTISAARRERPIEADAEIDGEIGLHIFVRLRPAAYSDRFRRKGSVGCRGRVHERSLGIRQISLVGGNGASFGTGTGRCRNDRMRVLRYLLNGQRYRGRALRFAKIGCRQTRRAAPMHWDLALQIRQGEVRRAIASEIRAEQGKQRCILLDREQLAVAGRPIHRSEGKTETANFAKVGV